MREESSQQVVPFKCTLYAANHMNLWYTMGYGFRCAFSLLFRIELFTENEEISFLVAEHIVYHLMQTLGDFHKSMVTLFTLTWQATLWEIS